MENFRAIERRFERTPVRLSGNADISGSLRIRGKTTSLHLSSPRPFEPEPDDDGWFDLHVKAVDGREMLLHHALLTQTADHMGPTGLVHSAQIFPNTIVDDARGLDASGRLSRIRFRLRGFNEFFHYRHMDSMRGSKLGSDALEMLRKLRHAADDELFDPLQLYAVNRYPEYFRFKIKGRTYSVWPGASFRGASWHRLDAKISSIATIEFDEPAQLDAALDYVWDWRRFFQQMAMAPISLTAICVSPDLNPRAPTGNLYLPNLRRKRIKPPRHFTARHLPLHRWEDRETLAEAMQSWLEKSEARQGFRGLLDRIIVRMDQRIDAADLIDLAGAIEALNETATKSPFPPGALDNAAAAAQAEFDKAKFSVTPDRISGVLGGLQGSSLAARIERLCKLITPRIANADIALVTKAAGKIRNGRAHGGVIEEQLQPRIRPTIEALAAACARFDLQDCGIPAEASKGATSVPALRLDGAIAELRALSSKGKIFT